MSNRRYPDEFKVEAVKQVTERGRRVKEVAEQPSRVAPAQQVRPTGGSIRFNLLIRPSPAHLHRGPRRFHFSAQELVVLARLALALDKLPHQFTGDLGRRPVGGLGFGHEGLSQLGLELHCEHGFFGRGGLRSSRACTE